MDRTEGGKTDGASIDVIADELKICCDAWDPKARLLGNIRAEDIGRLCDSYNELLRIIRGDFEYYQKLSDKNQNTPNASKFDNKLNVIKDILNEVEIINKQLYF